MVRRVLSLVSACAWAATLAACSDGSPGGGPEPDAAEPAPPDAEPAPPDAGPAPPDAPGADTRARKLLVIGVDGVRHDKLAQLSIPAMRALAARGVMSKTMIFAAPMAGTVSGPSWSSIATGVWPDKHRVFGNDFRDHNLAAYPDFLTRLEQARPALRTYAISDWRPLTETPGPVFTPAIDLRLTRDGYQEESWAIADDKITADAVDQLQRHHPDAAFVYLGNVDVVAHDGDTDLRYRAAVEKVDQQIGAMVAALEARPTYADENWLVMVTTDHGHVDGGGHGGSSWQERQSFIIAAGGDIAPGALAFEPRTVDIAPTVLAHFGVAVDPAWGLDGVALGTASTDVFDTLAPRLGAAVDELGVPIIGWTHEAPAGWTIDNSRMAAGGVTEWQGWSFASTEFWNLAEQGQSRESFVRSRGVIAIADPDEWNDTDPEPSRAGTFDSTLRSPTFAVAGGSTVVLRFASHYLQEGNQRGHVLVSFDGGLATPYLRYGPDDQDSNHGDHVVSRIETVPIQVPPGAREITVSWRLFDAGNNWYWAIDDPQLVGTLD
jgi:hypothetical protein